MIVETSPAAVHQLVRNARRMNRSIGLVPTMGALHAGHSSLIEAARRQTDFVVVTIFVNPTQFGPNEDFTRYPRTLESDLQICRDAGADLVFVPTVESMYQRSAQTRVTVTELTTRLEGLSRPGHFDGVSTVVAKLFLITDPDKAFFGQKDFQQQLVIRRMVDDLNFPVTVVTCPIVRESDGLAMSSRNRYLSPEDRERSLRIFGTLRLAVNLAETTSLSSAEISGRLFEYLAALEGIQVSYAIIADIESLEPLDGRLPPGERAVALIAARIGTTRLIDNEIITFH